eukprot:3657224-Prorocentrum_lima.AAC.1
MSLVGGIFQAASTGITLDELLTLPSGSGCGSSPQTQPPATSPEKLQPTLAARQRSTPSVASASTGNT